MAPIAERTVFPLYKSTQSGLKKTAPTLAAAAVRKMVPKFPGSCMASKYRIGRSFATSGKFSKVYSKKGKIAVIP